MRAPVRGTDTQSIVPGSLAAMAQLSGTSVAESFLNADAIVLIDVSSSMGEDDAPGGRTRYDHACRELAQIQAELPGRVAVVAFSGFVQFVPGGVPPFNGGSTNLAEGLRFIHVADGTVRFIVISDGQPDSEIEALTVARTFTSKLDTIFVGSETDKAGRAFLKKLAEASGGTPLGSFATADLGKNMTRLLAAGI